MLFFIDFPMWLKPEIIEGGFARWYGFMYLVAFAVAYALFQRQIKEDRGVLTPSDKDQISSFFSWGIAGLLLGARLLATTLYDTDHQFIKAPWKIFWPFKDFAIKGSEQIFGSALFYISIAVIIAAPVAYLYLKYKEDQKGGKKKKKTGENEENGTQVLIVFLGVLALGVLIFKVLFSFQFVGLMGMSYHGGVIGAIIAIIIYCHVKKLNLLQYTDYFAAAIPLGYSFGRLGNFINQELYGRITSMPWGVKFWGIDASGHGLVNVTDPNVMEIANKVGIDPQMNVFINLPRHPSQLYEALFEGVILFLIIWFVFRKRKPFQGVNTAVYLMGYGIFRFFIEYFRNPDVGLDFPIQFQKQGQTFVSNSLVNFTTGQILCFIMILAGIGILFYGRYLHLHPAVEKKDEDSSSKKKGINKKAYRKKLK